MLTNATFSEPGTDDGQMPGGLGNMPAVVLEAVPPKVIREIKRLLGQKPPEGAVLTYAEIARRATTKDYEAKVSLVALIASEIGLARPGRRTGMKAPGIGGRKAIGSAPREKVSITLDPDLIKWLREQQGQGESFSEVVQRLLRRPSP